jgi:hypothetical protein
MSNDLVHSQLAWFLEGTTMMYRQGDVLMVAITDPAVVAKYDAGAEKYHYDEHTAVVLASGEATGHDHVLHGRARYYADEIHLLEPGELRHELADGTQAEHNPIRLPPGWYRRIQQREYVEPTRSAPSRTRWARD